MTDVRTKEKNDLDALIRESRRIRDELIRTVSRLDVFVDQLMDEAAKLRDATGASDE